MFTELFGLLVGLDKEWIAQGATEAELSLDAFDWDYVDKVPCGGVTGFLGGVEEVVLEETDSYLIKRDRLGPTDNGRRLHEIQDQGHQDRSDRTDMPQRVQRQTTQILCRGIPALFGCNSVT